MRPVAIGRDEDVPRRRHAGATVPSPVMPAGSCIAVPVAARALPVPTAALVQRGGGGGAGDSQHQDPFGFSTGPSKPKAKPTAPAAQQAPTQPEQTSPQPTPGRTAPAPAPAATAPAAAPPPPAPPPAP